MPLRLSGMESTTEKESEKSVKKKLSKEDKQTAIDNYLAWAYADPKYREFTDRMVKEYLDTGVRPDVEARFKEYLDGHNDNSNNDSKSRNPRVESKTVHRDLERRFTNQEK
jgi:hypothetical protein